MALFGVDYYTSFFYGTGRNDERPGAVWLAENTPYPGGGYRPGKLRLRRIVHLLDLESSTKAADPTPASMRYLKPTLSLIVAVTLLEDYILTIVVLHFQAATSSFLSWDCMHELDLAFLIGAGWRSSPGTLPFAGAVKSSRVVFILLGVFVFMTVALGIGLVLANYTGVPPVPVSDTITHVSIGQALMHLLTASMKGMVALTGLEAMSNGIQFVKNKMPGSSPGERSTCPLQ